MDGLSRAASTVLSSKLLQQNVHESSSTGLQQGKEGGRTDHQPYQLEMAPSGSSYTCQRSPNSSIKKSAVNSQDMPSKPGNRVQAPRGAFPVWRQKFQPLRVYRYIYIYEGCSKGPCLRFILGRPFQLV